MRIIFRVKAFFPLLFLGVLLSGSVSAQTLEKESNSQEEQLFDRIQESEVSREENCKTYLKKYGSQGAYYNQVRTYLEPILKKKETVAYNNDDLDKMVELLKEYLELLNDGRGASDAKSKIVAKSEEKLRNAENAKNWSEAIKYLEYIRNYSTDEEKVGDSLYKIEKYQRKIEVKPYKGFGYQYNSELPFNFFFTRLQPEANHFGFYITLAWNSDFSRNISNDSNLPTENGINSATPAQMLFSTQNSVFGWLKLSGGATYHLYENIHLLGGLGIYNRSEWKIVTVFNRGSDLDSGTPEEIEHDGDSFPSDGWKLYPEVGAEYHLLGHTSIRYLFVFSSEENNALRHNIGLSVGF